ncbi:MAG: Rid family detoxifying hydrolase [Bacteroidales bacterium]|jgi:2-iminobutanoate/2-iminopropanoate deaminase
MKKIIRTNQAPQPVGIYSQAVLASGFLFVSGQIAINPSTGKVETKDIKEQTKQIMENIRHILKQANMDFSNIVKATIFLTEMSNFSLVNEIYGSYFTSDFPAREIAQVCKLPLGVDIEISVIACQ